MLTTTQIKSINYFFIAEQSHRTLHIVTNAIADLGACRIIMFESEQDYESKLVLQIRRYYMQELIIMFSPYLNSSINA